MKLSRAVFGLAVVIFVTMPLLGLARLSYDVRYVDFIKYHNSSGSDFPALSSWLWIFGPLDWWSFITPLALAVAAAAHLRNPMRLSTLALVLGAAVMQALALDAATRPYFSLTTVMGYPIAAPYPRVPLTANLSLVGVSVGMAVYSVSKCIARGWMTKVETTA